MTSFYISQLDREVNDGINVEAVEALRRVADYIRKTIDPSFPKQEFIKWADSDSEKPCFRHNAKRYFWSE